VSGSLKDGFPGILLWFCIQVPEQYPAVLFHTHQFKGFEGIPDKRIKNPLEHLPGKGNLPPGLNNYGQNVP
jgi:hypothetical protein